MIPDARDRNCNTPRKDFLQQVISEKRLRTLCTSNCKPLYFMADAGRDARERLKQERSDLQSVNPVPFGFFARPKRKRDGTTDFFEWTCGVVPKKSSPYTLPGGGCYEVKLVFTNDFPIDPPRAFFSPEIFHTNVFPNGGSVCLSILLNEGHHKGTVSSHWSPSMTILDILLGLQSFFDEPNPKSVANEAACELLTKSGRAAYNDRVKKEALLYEQRLEEHKKKIT